MNMKRTLFHMMQTGSLRIVVCTLALGLSATAFAQTDDEEEEEVETSIKQPDRSKLQQAAYPTITLKGVVTDQATKQPLAGIQLRALGYDRYTAMTGEDGSFTIKVPTFTTALYVYASQYLPQQVAITAGNESQTIAICRRWWCLDVYPWFEQHHQRCSAAHCH